MNQSDTPTRPIPAAPVYCPSQPNSKQLVIEYLLKAGRQAPSWYNCQPWQLSAADDVIAVVLDRSRDRSFYDWGAFNSLLACGAVVKNMTLAAKCRGVEASVSWFPDAENQLLLAHIKLNFHSERSPSEQDLALERAIWTRHTNTLMYDNTPLTESQLAALYDAVSDQNTATLQLLTGDNDKQQIFAAAACAEQIRFSRRDLHEQLHRMIRWNDEQAVANKTGYTLASMGACGFGKSFFWMTRPWWMMRLLNIFGAYKSQAQRACLGLKHCAAIGLLTIKGNSNHDLLLAGGLLQQLWLVAECLGLDFHPHNSIVQFLWAVRLAGFKAQQHEQHTLQCAEQLLQQVMPAAQFNNSDAAVVLFRVGKGAQVHGYTLRQVNRA